MVVIGPTGSGKTVLARAFLSSLPYVVVLDSKDELSWKGWKRAKTLEPIRWIDASRCILRAPIGGTRAMADGLFRTVYEQRGWTVYIDEVYSLGFTHTQVPSSYPLLLTRGRSRGITVWTGTQRPRFLPLFAFTESKHFFVFAVQSIDDLLVIKRQTSPEVAELVSGLKKHEFVYYNKETGQAIKSAPLSLKKGG